MTYSIHGFSLKREQYITEQNSLARLYEHSATGARLLFLENEDDNKVFSITFRTPARDSTGIAHILEHSVLAGSDKYPLKEPFVELIKGSLNTFINAITFPDKTMYPVASRNNKDFTNLIDVYLDAVFNPSIKHEPNIFKQEGWHYELSEPESELKLNGVVYNEMKGAYSAPDCVVEREIFETLFPEGPYGVESGGHPDFIPELKYSQFCKFHNKYYHPSNAWIFVYGNADIESLMCKINDEYLSKYQRIQVKSDIKFQEPFQSEKIVYGHYPVEQGAAVDNKTFLTYSFVVGKSTDTQDMMALKVLESILLDSAAAPLRRALIEAGIGQDICGDFDSTIYQPVFSIKAINANAKDADKFRNTIFETLQGIVDNGLDKKLIEATLNRQEFSLREADFGSYPKGLIYNIAVMDSWLYDGDPLAGLTYEQYLPALRSGLQSDYYEQLIVKYLLKNYHRALVVVEPGPGMNEEASEAVKQKLAAYKSGLSREELDKLVAETAELKGWQSREDEEEALLKIPVLNRDDLEHKAEKLPLEQCEIAGRPLLLSNIFTNKIVYCNLIYDMRAVSPDDFEYLNLLIAMLGKIDTAQRGFADLINEVNIRTGSMTVTNVFYSDCNNPGKFYPKVCVRFKALLSSFSDGLAIVEEILENTVFRNKKRFYEIIQELHAETEMTLLEDGNGLAAAEMLARLVPAGNYQARSLRSFYKFIRAVDKDFENRYAELTGKLTDIATKIFDSSNLQVHLTCLCEELPEITPALEAFIEKSRKSDNSNWHEYAQPVTSGSCGLVIPSKVQYVFKGINFFKSGYKYSGSLKVLDTILSYDYLWSKIRILGGAYGAFARFMPNGAMYLGSYRDPHLARSLEAYDDVVSYLENFNVSDREMLKYIIGTLSRIDLPLTPYQKGQAALQDYFGRRDYKAVQKERDELLSTNQSVIRDCANMLKTLRDGNLVCVVGGKEKIKQYEDYFDEIVEVVS